MIALVLAALLALSGHDASQGMPAMAMPSSQANDGEQSFVRVLQPGDRVPNATVIDQTGRSLAWPGAFLGHTTVVSFIYTRCRDSTMCPLVSAKFEQLQKMLPPNARLVEFTLDASYDTPAVLARYGQTFGADPARWTLATGDGETMRTIAGSFGIGIGSRTPLTIVHSELVAIVDKDGKLVRIVEGNSWTPQEVDANVRQAEGMSANVWQRFMLGVRGVARQCGIPDNGLGHVIEIAILLVFILLIAAGVVVADIIARWWASRQ